MQEESYEEWQTFLPSSNGLVKGWSKTSDEQIKYMQMCSNAVKDAVGKIENGIKTIEDLYKFLAEKRKDIAKELRQEPEADIGELRKPSDLGKETPLDDGNIGSTDDNRYCDQFEGLKRMFDEMLSNNSNGLNYSINKKDNSTFIDILSPNQKNVPNISEIEFNYEKKALLIVHTKLDSTDSIARVWKFLNSSFQINRISKITSDEELYRTLGKIAWWLAHIMPTKRGNSSITDMLTKTLTLFCGKKLKPFNEGINWDLLAIFSHKLDDYSKKYYSLFVESEQQLTNFLNRYKSILSDDLKILNYQPYTFSVSDEKSNVKQQDVSELNPFNMSKEDKSKKISNATLMSKLTDSPTTKKVSTDTQSSVSIVSSFELPPLARP